MQNYHVQVVLAKLGLDPRKLPGLSGLLYEYLEFEFS